ncbi:MAG: prephenate dehydrogenase/arogenate dehydrogenase family protein [Acidobacteriota bacterium]
MANSLDQLRKQLADVDREILERIALRQKLALEVGKHKLDAGMHTRDYNQEKEVIQRATRDAQELGLLPSFAEKLMVLLIEASLTVQEQDRVSRQAEGGGRRVLVIGGAGKMGRWMVRFLSSQGFLVEVADPKGAVAGHIHYSDWKEPTLDHDIIVLASPMPATARILLEMAESPPPGLIFDIGSLKSPLRKGLTALAKAGANVSSIHPMFGPDTQLLSGRHVIFVDVGVPDATRQVRQLFDSTMAIHVETDLESHDRLIAYVLGLSHALNIAFFTALAESGEAAPRLAQLSSTTFDAQLEIASQVARDNPRMYFEIQTLNDYGTESLTALLSAVERVRSLVRAGDEDGFVALMEKGLSYLEGRAKASQDEALRKV